MATVYLLTGAPGTGKTTLIREAIARIKASAGGFYTQEIRVGGERQGFKLATLQGQDAVLSHITFSSPHRVSKYGVDINSLDRIGVIALTQAIKENDIIVIDEIGKMELFSARFREVVLRAIESGKKVLGTIMLQPHPFTNQIKQHPQVKIIQVSRANHDRVLNELLDWLKPTTNENNP